MIAPKLLYSYALLRLAGDSRPEWARALGIREINGTDLVSLPRRLAFTRKLSSHLINPYAPTKLIQDWEDKFAKAFNDLYERFSLKEEK